MIHVCKNPRGGGGFHFLAHGLLQNQKELNKDKVHWFLHRGVPQTFLSLTSFSYELPHDHGDHDCEICFELKHFSNKAIVLEWLSFVTMICISLWISWSFLRLKLLKFALLYVEKDYLHFNKYSVMVTWMLSVWVLLFFNKSKWNAINSTITRKHILLISGVLLTIIVRIKRRSLSRLRLRKKRLLNKWKIYLGLTIRNMTTA